MLFQDSAKLRQSAETQAIPIPNHTHEAEQFSGGLSIKRILQIVALLWISYFLILTGLDWVSLMSRPDTSPLPWFYYAIHITLAGVVFGLATWDAAQQRLGRVFMPLIIGLISVVPILLTPLITSGPGPITTEPGLVVMRLCPMLCVAVVIVAWQYTWRQVVWFCLVTGALILLPILLRAPRFSSAVAITIVQTSTFLVFGYALSALVQRLRLQNAALIQAHEQLRDYAGTQERLAISRERNRVARELHDTLAHALSGLIVQLEAAKLYREIEPTTSHKLQDSALDAARHGLQETRLALKALRARPLDDLGLALALRQLAEQLASTAQLTLDLSISPKLPPLALEVETCVYRVAQEALRNAIRHANANRLDVSLTCIDTELCLVVRDDGCGFEFQSFSTADHFGLAGMHERAAELGGQLSINSQLGLGTWVELRFTTKG
ncbi:MAG TPA: sensor histidine kinase [Herpetosiphon sp.]|uniref:histidine kinase n=1 Tax=Herpetosiphon aurantiacus (strain ATCC 23779 / DSM 785 / 114-95) TaxID=316274 RepID=A9AX02_HERA2|nr:sensor histidine kinase [Herpetosiphon sp.]ABX04810.1 integral membrane sensor signal transduction histidine kinase [Herpetosiphon aurantiacus DSM 785]HBW52486.1 sensor histidine kinase [Herpetosiphon sp.]